MVDTQLGITELELEPARSTDVLYGELLKRITAVAPGNTHLGSRSWCCGAPSLHTLGGV
eukprot:CAMPEP_0119019470 /NCGR_PEP_ID=MMETSP1176-20130426/21925_1 /TAXON_ID=265551 /ORGANISM="Synedropsis recta cf, Strain CCMP1620" /LENGTH=58 /DNA_ID=CAMNT_0006973675 /DNA_START=205 /DNA_END=381 /DNA_ORIENTATION=+